MCYLIQKIAWPAIREAQTYRPLYMGYQKGHYKEDVTLFRENTLLTPLPSWPGGRTGLHRRLV